VGGAAGLGVAEQLHAEFAAGIGARFGESLDVADLGQDGGEVGHGGVWVLGWFLCFRLGSRKFISMNFPAKRGGGVSWGVSSVHSNEYFDDWLVDSVLVARRVSMK
jgi:hypothetical protein